jgi:hypothetical protein
LNNRGNQIIHFNVADKMLKSMISGLFLCIKNFDDAISDKFQV